MTLERLKFHYAAAKHAMARGDFSLARDEFLSLVGMDPNLDFAHYNLASCYIELKQFQKAYDHYFYVLSLKGELSQDPDLFFNLGVCAEKLNQFQHAEGFYQEAIKLNPKFFSAYFNLGLLAKFLNKLPLALHSFEQALAIFPDHPEAQLHHARLSDDGAIKTLPRSHIQSLFDGYADHYDIHMQQVLSYSLPDFMASMMGAALREYIVPSAALKILDMGCGTGLLGQALYDNIKTDHVLNMSFTLEGVDLSPKMLQKAGERAIYQRLTHQDLLAYLQSAPSESYDGLMAADVVNYLGDLSLFFEQANRVLKPSGWLCFSVEDLETKSLGASVSDFILLETCRFAHNQNYVKNKIEKSGFKLKKMECFGARTQSGKSVEEMIYFLNN